MKKIVSLILVLIIVSLSATCFAEGVSYVFQENGHNYKWEETDNLFLSLVLAGLIESEESAYFDDLYELLVIRLKNGNKIIIDCLQTSKGWLIPEICDYVTEEDENTINIESLIYFLRQVNELSNP